MNCYLLNWAIIGLSATVFCADRYEAEAAVIDENTVEVLTHSAASGGSFVKMKSGNLAFNVKVEKAGFYTLHAYYTQPYDEMGKIQNLEVNGISVGQMSFPFTEEGAWSLHKACSKMKLAAGSNTIGITKSWGWIDLDYIEISPFESTPFSLSGTLVTPEAGVNAKTMYSFMKGNFGKKVISGAMTNTVMQNDGKYTPNSVENQAEVAWIINASGKTPALLGFDFMHGTGLKSDNEWHQGYNKATLSMAEEIFKKGGIPVYCWHWKDPSHKVEAFYTKSSGNIPYVEFDLNKAFTQLSPNTVWNISSEEYQAILRDIDMVAGYLSALQSKGVPVLWRPLHEASGGWFWWGAFGAAPAKALYHLIFDRMVNHHKLNNLIWVWTTDEAEDALEWYPGDVYVDIIGRDYYYYPRIANHGSLMASFEKLKEIFQGKKMIALTENGSIPHPDSMLADESHWSYFMPWYGDYTMDGWAHDNTAADWKSILNHDFVLTLDEMPGWDKFTARILPYAKCMGKPGRHTDGNLEFFQSNSEPVRIQVFNPLGSCLKTLYNGYLESGFHNLSIGRLNGGMYIIRVQSAEKSQFYRIGE